MSKILYFRPGFEPEVFEHQHLASWMLEMWPAGSVRPRGLKLYLNKVSEENDITDRWRDDPQCVMQSDSDYIVVELPKGPAAVFVPYIIAAVVAVAATLILAPGASGTATIGKNNRPSSNNDLQGRSNSPRAGARIADIRGYVRAYPDLLMNYNIFLDRTEYEVQFLCVGTGEYLLEDILDGITPVQNISGERLSFYKGGTAPGYGEPYLNVGGAIDLNAFPVMVARSSNEADGTEVKPPNYADISKATFKIYSTGEIDTNINNGATSVDWSERLGGSGKVTLVDFYSFTPNAAIPGTYTRNNLSGTYNVVSAGDNLLLLNITGKPGWSALSSTGQDAYLQAYVRTDGLWEFTSGSGKTLVKFKPNISNSAPYIVGPYLLDECDQILINLYAQSGVYKTDGDIYPFTCYFEVILADPSGQGASVTHNMSLTGRMDEAVGSSLKVANPFPGRSVFVYVRRTSTTDKEFSGTVIDTVKWRDLYAISTISPRSYGDLTLVHTVTKATNAALKQKERKLNMLATRYYNGVASRNFADVIMSIHTDPFFGRRGFDTIDVNALYSVQQQILDYFGDPRSIQVGYTFDNQDTTYEEALQIICAAVNVTPYQIGSVLYFWPELPQDTSSMQFGHAFKIPDSDKRTRSFSPQKDYTGIQVKYFDHDQKSYLYVTAGETTNLNKIELLSCQSKWLAQVRAKREFNKLLYQRITHECTALSIGLQAAPGMRIDMVDNTRMSQMEGIVVDVNGLRLTLSDPVNFIPGNQYSITLTHTLGTLENLSITAGDTEFEVVLNQYPSEEIYTGWLRDKTAYIIRTDDQRTRLAMLVQTMEPSGRDNNYQVGLTCINYDARYYKDDLS